MSTPNTIKFPADDLREMRWSNVAGFTKVDTSTVDERRWTVVRQLVFRHESTGDQLWGVLYHDPATEMQEDMDDDMKWDYKLDANGDVECFEVEAVPSVTYRKVVAP